MIKLKITIVSMPAMKKRTPAKRIMVKVSSELISKRLYPILIAGNAEPQSKQHRAAKSQTAAVFVKSLDFFISVTKQ